MGHSSLVSDATLVLRRWLESSHFKPGARLPSERVMAAQLQLKHYALNRAMGRLISEGMVEREGYKLSYTPKKQTPPAFSCDLIVARRSIHIKGYRKTAKELGIHLRIHLWESLEESLIFLHQLDSPNTESVIFDPPHGNPSSHWEPAMSRLLQHGIPALTIRQQAPKIPAVLADHAKALEMAFNHLRDLGHKDLALITVYPRATSSIEVLEAWHSLCHHHGCRTSEKRVFFQGSNALREDAHELSQKLSRDWRQVTALVLYSEHDSIIHLLLEEFSRLQRQVPRDHSIIVLGDSKYLQTANPPISSATFDASLTQEVAFTMIQRMARKKRDVGLLPPPWCIKIEPDLTLRASTAAAPSFVPPAKKSSRDPSKTTAPGEFEGDLPGHKQELESISRRAYDLTSRVQENRFQTIDLSPFVNRPLNFRRGWLGDLPLKNFVTGKHFIHGIPFQVLGGTSRSDCGAVVFHSSTNTTGSARQLPDVLRIPIGYKIRALYILHGCGYARYMQHFATYSFYAGKKLVEAVPLVSLGQPPPSAGDKGLAAQSLKANIQDWWPDFPHVDFPHARRAPVLEHDNDEVVHRHVYLYSLEWINPHPELEITEMEIKVVDPSHSTTLGLLGVSVLKK